MRGSNESKTMDLEEALDGKDIPDEFHLGRPGRSSVYHTTVCYKVKTALKRKSMARRGLTGEYIRTTTKRIKEFHDLDHCEVCQGERPEMGHEGDLKP